MPTIVGLEPMFSTKLVLNWKFMRKRRRSSRKSVARSFNGLAKVGNSTCPKRVGDSSWGVSDKDSVSPHACCSLLLEDQETAKLKLGEGYQANCGFKGVDDFSGIELLATAASMEVDGSANNQNLVVEDSSIDVTAHGDNSNCSSVLGNSAAASRGLCSSAPKVNRQHWDLNTLMDAWEEQYDDTIAGNSTNVVNIEETKLNTDSEKHLGEPLSNPYFNGAGETSYRAVEKDANERNKTTYTVVKMPIEEYSNNLRESDEKTSGSDRTLDVTTQDMSTSEIPRSPINVQRKDNRDSGKTPELHGTFILDNQLVLSSSTKTDSRVHLGLVAPTAKREDNSLAVDLTEKLSKKCSIAGARRDDLAASVGKIGSAAIQNELTGLHEGEYDSPYEDGELRGSFLYSWEDDEIENKFVDYESDGRNGDGSDAAAAEIDSLVEEFPGEKSKGDETALRIRVNKDNMKGSKLISRRDEYAPKTPVGKLHSRMEGWSSMDATDGKDGFFIQKCRKPRFGMGRFKYTQNEGERDRARRFTSWDDSRGRSNYNTRYQGPENHRTHIMPRRKTVDYPPKGIQIRPPFMRRSPPPVERDEYFFRRMPLEYRDRGRFPHVRNFRNDDDFGPDSDPGFLPHVPMRRYMSNRERSFSPPPMFRNPPHMPFLPPRMRSRSRSRSRTHSPRFRRNNNRSRSPDFRHEPRMHKMRMMRDCSRPEYGDGVYVQGRRSPTRVLRYGGNSTNQSFDGNMRKRFRQPSANPRRFSNYDGRRRGRGDADFEAMEFGNNENDDVRNDDVVQGPRDRK